MDIWGSRGKSWLCVVQTPLGLICRNHKQIRKAEVRPQEPYQTQAR